jgi:DNA-directed RNA polymerase specialized sigma24 family protein
MDDIFPSTHDSWLCEMLDGPPEQVERAAVSLTARYREPLRLYFEGSSFRRLGAQGLVDFGDGEDLVHGFLATRVARAEFLAAWRKSGMRLRRFVINGFIFYLREQARAARRRRSREQTVADGAGEALEDDSIADFDRAWAVSVIREASEKTAASLADRGRAKHWELFRRHFVDGVPYGELVEPFGLTPSQAASAARDVAFELRRCLRAVLSRDGITEADVGPELALIEQMLRPDGRR